MTPALAVACIVAAGCLWLSLALLRSNVRLARELDGLVKLNESLREDLWEVRHSRDTWHNRYTTLQAEVDHEQELEDGEEYVRQSLGYPKEEN